MKRLVAVALVGFALVSPASAERPAPPSLGSFAACTQADDDFAFHFASCDFDFNFEVRP
jgi:hypothetical protein